MDNIFGSQALSLRPFEPDDLPALRLYLNHPELAGRRYIAWRLPELAPLSASQVEQYFSQLQENQEGFTMAITLGESQELIGHAECDWGWDPHCPTLTVVIAPAYQRRGYGSAVVRMQLRYLFEFTPAHTVSAWISSWNAPGLAFAQACGFHDSGRMRRSGVFQGKYCDTCVMDLLRGEWLAGRGG